MYALIGLSLFLVPAVLGAGAWLLSRRDIKTLRMQREEILARMNEGEATATDVQALDPAKSPIADADTDTDSDAPDEDVERNEFRKSGRRLHNQPSTLRIATMIGDELHFFDENGHEVVGVGEESFLYFETIPEPPPSEVEHLFTDGRIVKSALVRHHGIISYPAEMHKFSKVIAKESISGRVFTQGGIKARGRKKTVFIPTKDEKASG